MPFRVPERYRVMTGEMASFWSDGNNGNFILPHPKIANYVFTVQASDGDGWEHVSVSVRKNPERKFVCDRCPTWAEMCWVKDQFWSKDMTVIQYHPSQENYVNAHEFTLHLWRPTGVELPTPDKAMV